MNICTPAMATAGGLALRSARPGDYDKGAARLIWEAMERRRVHDEAMDRNAAMERRRVQNTPWNVPRDDASPG